MTLPRTRVRLALASFGVAVLISVVGALGVVSEHEIGSVTNHAVSRRIDLVRNSAAFLGLLAQKGVVAQYLLTGDRRWLAPLDESRVRFARWLEGAHRGGTGGSAAALLPLIKSEYERYDSMRARAVRDFDRGQLEDAKAALARAHKQASHLLALFQRFDNAEARADERALVAAEVIAQHHAELTIATCLAGILTCLALGILWVRRIARPIQQLQARVRSAAERMCVKVDYHDGELDGLSEQFLAITRKLEDTDAVLAEQRRLLHHREKLSAVGELAAKLGHEILNPLAGMKIASQVLAREERGERSAADQLAAALGHEISRVEALVHRLLDYTKPLTPRLERCSVAHLLDRALEATRTTRTDTGSSIERHEDPSLPPVDLDPLLITQALTNVLANAAQAMAPDGGIIRIETGILTSGGQRRVRIAIADQGPGIAAKDRERMFQPFFTTKPKGHGLGLSISQSILREHGGHIDARNRVGERGAIFELQIPLRG
ncbi:MAG: ATP-binding protein [Kofleriaceae bacterium]